MDRKQIAQLIIARLGGDEIDRRFRYYQSLVKKGIGGFIIFGGDARGVKDGIRRLQEKAEYPLFIASDLEQGLGQQIRDGTVFPPAMAIASAIDRNKRKDVRLLRDVIDTIAMEAKAVGINLILAPVADVNTNPDNPIICTRSFSDDPEDVSWFVKEYVKGIQRHGIMACVKHFPGHGGTSVDSHLTVPVVETSMKRLEEVELYPFREAIKAGVRVVMIGHLMVPAIDKTLSTFSKKMITGLLRRRMGFGGLITTDAMNMKSVSGWGNDPYGMAVKAGIDIILHPEEPERAIEMIYKNRNSLMPELRRAFDRIIRIKKRLRHGSINIRNVGKRLHKDLSMKITERSLKIDRLTISRIRHILSRDDIVLLVVDDDNLGSGDTLYQSLKRELRGLKCIYVDNKYKNRVDSILEAISGKPVIIAVFSRISGFKGRGFLSRRLRGLLKRAVDVAGHSVVIGFCCPYHLRDIEADAVIKVYPETRVAQGYMAKVLSGY